MPIVPFRWPSLDVSTSGGVGPQVNNFEQVSSDDHKMSVAGRRGGGGVCSMSGIGGGRGNYC